MTAIGQLIRISDVLLDDQLNFLELSNALAEYKKLLLRISAVDLNDPINIEDVHFSNGKALGTTWAARCIDDLLRTKRFVKGLYKAIEHLKSSKKEPIHILYAGCGPFASLALPIMAKYSEREVRFTLLEINDLSFRMVKKVLSTLELMGFVDAIIQEDATQYIIPNRDEVDIILSETMQQALEKEQQVPIMYNLVRQVDEHVLLIPEKIDISLGLVSMNATGINAGIGFAQKCEKLLDILELSAKAIKGHLARDPDVQPIVFDKKSVILPGTQSALFHYLAVLTSIQVFADEGIDFNDSGLTVPLILENLDLYKDQDLRIDVQYQVNSQPGVKYQINPINL